MTTLPLHLEAFTFANLQWTTVIQLLILDLTLGLNNIVGVAPIGAAIPHGRRRRVLCLASLGAFVLRVVMLATAQVLTLLPHLSLLAGVYLCYLGYRLVMDRRDRTARIDRGIPPNVEKPKSRHLARRIAIVDASLSIDNVAALVAAAHAMLGTTAMLTPLPHLVPNATTSVTALVYCCIAVAVSIPLVMSCAVALAPLLNRTAWLTWLGAALLVWSGLSVAAADPWWLAVLRHIQHVGL
jgi:predicted tellurium resistance membrane protein TerC